MIPAARIQATIEVLDHVLNSQQAADRALRQYFRTRRYAGSRDRAAVAELLFAVLRDLAYGVWVGGAELSARQAVAIHLQRSGEDPAESFTGAGHAPAPLDEAERSLLAGLPDAAAALPPWVVVNCPPWLYARFAEHFGDATAAELEALNVRASVDLRVNLLKTNRERVLAVLAEDGIGAERGEISPTAVRLTERADLTQHRLYLQGHVEIQDEGSQAVADLCRPLPGEQVVDFCAGAGGKTLALAAGMDGKGQVYALDTDARRLARLKPRLDRARAHNIQIHALAGENDPWLGSLMGRADCVLVDAPCTGTGAWRRQPEARWQLREARLDDLTALQDRILDSAARLVKPGGRLIYATCSLLPEENELRIDGFLSRNPNFVQTKEGDGKPSSQLRLTPHRHGTDGFYAAVLTSRA